MSHNRDLSAAAGQFGFHSSNIGIGSEAPQNRLDVAGDVKILDNSPRLFLYDANANGASNATGGFEVFDKDGNKNVFVGAFAPNADNLIFGVTGSERLRIDSTGNIGIGTETIQANTNYNTLEIVGDAGTTGGGIVRLKTGDLAAKTMLFCDTGGFEARVETNHPLVVSTNNTERLRVTSDGKVGIGTEGNTAPTAPLSIKVGSGGEYVQDFRGSSTKQWGFFYDQNNWNAATFRIDEFDNNGTATSRLTITDGGLVGIGTNNPSGKLNIVGGDSQLLNIIQNTGDLQIRLNDRGAGSAYIKVPDNTGGALAFWTGGGERLRITSAGDFESGNITISSVCNTHNVGNYSVFLSDNHANTFFGQNLRLDYNGATNSGNHQLRVINQHASVGGAGMLIGGNGSPYVNQLKFYTVAANQPAGTRVDDVAARMTIDTSGRVTKPNQPAFFVYRNQSSWSLAANDVFIFNTAELNVGSHYNTSNGRFTAPITGRYVFHFFSIYTGNANSDSIEMYKNGSRMYGGDVHFTNSIGSAWDCVHYSRVIQLSSGDYVHMQTRTGHTFHGNHWGGWSGYMLG